MAKSVPQLMPDFVRRGGLSAVINSSFLLKRSTHEVFVQMEMAELVNNLIVSPARTLPTSFQKLCELSQLSEQMTELVELLMRHFQRYRPYTSRMDKDFQAIFSFTADSLFRLSRSAQALRVVSGGCPRGGR